MDDIRPDPPLEPSQVGSDTSAVRMTALVRGRVQGVGFRWFVRRVARDLGLAGSAANRSDGAVDIVAEGSRDACERLVDTLRGGRSPGQVDQVTVQWSPASGLRGFAVE